MGLGDFVPGHVFVGQLKHGKCIISYFNLKKSLTAKLSTYIKIHNKKKVSWDRRWGYEMGAREFSFILKSIK